VLHRFFDKHADKIGKELLSLSKPSGEGDPSTINGKRAWDGLCALLVDLGSPLEVPRPSPLPCADHKEYLDLMARYAKRDTAPVEEIFLETSVPAVCSDFWKEVRHSSVTGSSSRFCLSIIEG
jgi:hypothetical protein